MPIRRPPYSQATESARIGGFSRASTLVSVVAQGIGAKLGPEGAFFVSCLFLNDKCIRHTLRWRVSPQGRREPKAPFAQENERPGSLSPSHSPTGNSPQSANQIMPLWGITLSTLWVFGRRIGEAAYRGRMRDYEWSPWGARVSQPAFIDSKAFLRMLKSWPGVTRRKPWSMRCCACSTVPVT